MPPVFLHKGAKIMGAPKDAHGPTVLFALAIWMWVCYDEEKWRIMRFCGGKE